MNEQIFEKGLVKVVWIQKDLNRIYSKMFEGEKSAEDFGKQKGDYLIFRLIKQKGLQEFEWEILPYGNYHLYEKLIRYYQKYKGNIVQFISQFLP